MRFSWRMSYVDLFLSFAYEKSSLFSLSIADLICNHFNSWLEEIKQRQAEVLAARLSTDKLRERDKRLVAENNKFKVSPLITTLKME